MKLLKTQLAYRRWSTGRDGWDTYGDRWENRAPTLYPCWAYTVVSDWGMEELEPRYLYAADVALMLNDLRKACA